MVATGIYYRERQRGILSLDPPGAVIFNSIILAKIRVFEAQNGSPTEVDEFQNGPPFLCPPERTAAK